MKTSTENAMTKAPTVSSWLRKSQPMPGVVAVRAARHPEQAQEVHREEREVEPDEHGPEVELAEPLVEEPAVQLREPVVEAAEEPEHEPAEQHVVEVRDDEVRVGLLRVGGDDRVQHAREAAEREHRDEPEREQHRRLEPHRAAATPCASQLKIFTPVGTAMIIVESAKAEIATGPSPVANMWCTHTPQPMNPIAMPENTTTG